MQQIVTFAEKDSQERLLKIRIIKKLENIANSQINAEVQHMVYVT